jgi:hypothetical protein
VEDRHFEFEHGLMFKIEPERGHVEKCHVAFLEKNAFFNFRCIFLMSNEEIGKKGALHGKIVVLCR